MKQVVTSIIILVLIGSCLNSKKDMITDDFYNNKKTYEEAALFLEDMSKDYDFASLDISQNKIRLTLGNKGVQTTRLLEDSEVKLSIVHFVRKGQNLLMKKNEIIYFQLYGSKQNGIEKSGGILKNLGQTKPKINFSWMQNYQIKQLEKDWYIFNINDKTLSPSILF